jgi:hypothetical protein
MDTLHCLMVWSSTSRSARWWTTSANLWLANPSPLTCRRAKVGADVQDRTGDLVLTKDALCQLSYIGLRASCLSRGASADKSALSFSRPNRESVCQPALVRSGTRFASQSSRCEPVERSGHPERRRGMERETGIEPATNSLEGCDSTTELLPPTPRTQFALRASAGTSATLIPLCRCGILPPVLLSSADVPLMACQPKLARVFVRGRVVAREGLEPSKPLGRQIYSLLRLTASLPRQLTVVLEKRTVSAVPATGSSVDGAGEGIRTPDLLITNQLLYRPELRQPRQKVNFSTSRATLQVRAWAG